MPIIAPVPRSERRLMKKFIHKTRDKDNECIVIMKAYLLRTLVKNFATAKNNQLYN
ncbi:hypothetical protein [Xenorhabdus indica]|uniref:hypothetical protein n=1 Tax=Xenorhabdus indica TaxID=333964 RepID=UPI000AE4047B|nr:transposase [Xenorhabdus indica]